MGVFYFMTTGDIMSDNTAFFAEQSANSEVKMQIVLTAFK